MAARTFSFASTLVLVSLSVSFAGCGSEISDPRSSDVLSPDTAGVSDMFPSIPDLGPGTPDDIAHKEILVPDAPAPEDVVDESDLVLPPPACLDDYECDDGDYCTFGYCDDEGVCQYEPKEGFCHIDGECYEAGETDPDNPCRACLPLSAGDEWTPDDTLDCAEDDLCATWSCRDGECVAHPILHCEDNNPCTTAYCDGDVGCVFEPREGACDNGDPCTIGDYCEGGDCVAGPDRLVCDNGDPCTVDTCEPGRGCVHEPRDGPCDDGDACTVDTHCVDGQCLGTPKECDDGDPCTDAWCDPVHGCLYRDNEAPCDDGDPCTVGDRCVGRVCVGGPDTLVCDDGNPCTDGHCVPYEGCVYTDNDDPCDDGDACTTGGVCMGGECVATGEVDCDDGNPCTANGCDPDFGCFEEPLTGPECDDGLVCTVDDTCIDGVCQGTPKDCDDGNDCTLDRCIEPHGCRNDLIDSSECALGIVITEPARGVTLDHGALEEGLVPVRGYVVSPADPAPALTLDGAPLALVPLPSEEADPDRPNPDQPHRFAFETAVVPEHAMNMLRLKATDSFEQEAKRVQSFYYSTVYYPMTEDDFDATKVPAGVAIGLSQEFMDDPDATSLASLVDLIFGNLDIMDFIDNPVARVDELGCRYDLNITSASFSGTSTTIRITDDGLALNLTLSDLDIRFRLRRTSGGFWCPGSQNGRITADSARIETRVRVTVVDGALSVTLDEDATQASFSNFDVSVDAWFDFLVGWFRGMIQDTLEEALEDIISDQVGPLLATVFDALLLELDIEIPPLMPGADPAMVAFRTRISDALFAADEYMHLEMDAAVLTARGVPYERLGSLGYANCLESPFGRNAVDFTPYEPLNVGLFDDVANQILHAAWRTGAFELNLGSDVIPVDELEQFGVSELDLEISLLLPPVLTSCKDLPAHEENPDAILLELGDLEVRAELVLNGVPVELLMYTSAAGTATLGILEDEEEGSSGVGIQLLGFDRVETDLVEVVSPDPAVGAMVGVLIEQALLPILLDEFAMDEPIGFELPVIDLSNPEAGIPEGTALVIELTEVLRSADANTIMKGRANQIAAP